MEQTLTVRFLPSERIAYVPRGSGILEAANGIGLSIDSPCAGQGVCGKCKVKITQGAVKPTESERRFIDEADLKDGWRLACQARANTDMVVFVTEMDLESKSSRILERSFLPKQQSIAPLVMKRYMELPAPTLEDPRADRERVEAIVGPLAMDCRRLGSLVHRFRENGYQGTLVQRLGEFIDFEPGDTCTRCYGVAFDVGTTTLVGALLDLKCGREMAVTSRLNPQVRYGDDVLSRIQHVTDVSSGLDDLNMLIREALGDMIGELRAQSDVEADKIYEVVLAGNTTMQQLLCGIDPTPLGRMPYVPACSSGLAVDSRDLSLPIHLNGKAYVMPVISGFVGGDIVAGIALPALREWEKPLLLIDLGTNGEIVLMGEEGVWAASTAAGPAFEGARIRCGMRATTGAIDTVVFDGDIVYEVIGDGPATGLCGSALIDLVAGLLTHGLVDTYGRMLRPNELSAQVPEGLRQRVRVNGQGEVVFWITDQDSTPWIYLTAGDIREFQLAVGAIRAGITMLLKHSKVDPKKLSQVMIAGGLGNTLQRANARIVGLIPAHIDTDKVYYIGNMSLAGAKQVLMSGEVQQNAEEWARRVTPVELSLDRDFQTEFAEAMIFPEIELLK